MDIFGTIDGLSFIFTVHHCFRRHIYVPGNVI